VRSYLSQKKRKVKAAGEIDLLVLTRGEKKNFFSDEKKTSPRKKGKG